MVVATPTFLTLTSSLSIFKISFTDIVLIPLRLIIVVVKPTSEPTLFSNVCVTSVLIKGYCAVSSTDINAFSLRFAMANSWKLPSPTPVNVTAAPALVVDIKNASFVTDFAKTVVGKVSIIDPFLNCIGVEPTPTNVDLGV